MLDDTTRLKIALYISENFIFGNLIGDNCLINLSPDDLIDCLEQAKSLIKNTAYKISQTADTIGVSLDDLVTFHIEMIDNMINKIKADNRT